MYMPMYARPVPAKQLSAEYGLGVHDSDLSPTVDERKRERKTKQKGRERKERRKRQTHFQGGSFD